MMRDIDFVKVTTQTLEQLEVEQQQAYRAYAALTYDPDSVHPMRRPGVSLREWLAAQQEFADSSNRVELALMLAGRQSNGMQPVNGLEPAPVGEARTYPERRMPAIPSARESA